MKLNSESPQLIRNLFQAHPFYDCEKSYTGDKKIDVVVPVLHSNDLWRENLLSFYREIPINRLIIGDAGCIDDTISIAREFPRVEIINHKSINTLGASIADLISRVTTQKFAYLQSDVYLPNGWFSEMELKGRECAWVGSPMQVVTMLDYRVDYSGKRPLAGAQLGETSAFKNLSEFVEDDYVYRQEDFVLEAYLKRNGFVTGNCLETFHYHQVMRRKTLGMQMNVESIAIKLMEESRENDRVSNTQLFGFLKYCDPKIREVRLAAYGAFQEQRSILPRKLINAVKFANAHNKLWISPIMRFGLKFIIMRLMGILNSLVLKITDIILRTG